MHLNVNARTRFLGGVLGLSAALIAALVGVYLRHSGAERTRQYLERAEFFTAALADRAAWYLSQDKTEELKLLAGTLTWGSVLYVQVVRDGTVVLEERSLEGRTVPLPLTPVPQALERRRARTEEGVPYVEVALALPTFAAELEGYVRVGTALSRLEAELRTEQLTVAGIGAGVLAVIAMAAWLMARRVPLSLPAPAPAPAPQPQGQGTLSDRDSDSDAAPPTAEAEGEPAALCVGPLLLDDARKRVQVRGRAVELSPKEYELLKLLSSQPGRVFSNEEILRHVWATSRYATAQDVKQYVYFLRRKLEADPNRPELIVTVRGFGYKLES